MISKTEFIFTTKISYKLCFSIYIMLLDLLTRGIKSLRWKKLSRKNFPLQKCRAGWRINQPQNYTFCSIFSRQIFFLFNHLKISTIADLIENFKSKTLCCKISISERWMCKMWFVFAKRERNVRKLKLFPYVTNTAELFFSWNNDFLQNFALLSAYKFQIQKLNCHTSLGWTQPVNRAVSTNS